jgi:N-methylhydantoinase A
LSPAPSRWFIDVVALNGLIDILRKEYVEAVAVSLLFSFANDSHENAVGSALGSLGVPISLSSRILPEYREYERTSTTVINAYLAPRMGQYLTRLNARIQGSPLRVMQSNGGVVQARTAAESPVRTIVSGPAGGVVGAFELAAMSGYRNIITFDMGGTSTDVALCEGTVGITHEGEIDGMPVGVPMIDIHTVGAGGGSIAQLDMGNALKVGPERRTTDGDGCQCHSWPAASAVLSRRRRSSGGRSHRTRNAQTGMDAKLEVRQRARQGNRRCR